MPQILTELEDIESAYANAEYIIAYEKMRNFCRKNEVDEKFTQAALNILSRHNDLELSIMNGSLDLTQQNIQKQEIRISFQTLNREIKRRFNPTPNTSGYKTHAIRFEEKREDLKKTLSEIESDSIECECDAKSRLLQEISNELKKAIAHFRHLIKQFKAVQEL